MPKCIGCNKQYPFINSEGKIEMPIRECVVLCDTCKEKIQVDKKKIDKNK